MTCLQESYEGHERSSKEPRLCHLGSSLETHRPRDFRSLVQVRRHYACVSVLMGGFSWEKFLCFPYSPAKDSGP